MRQRVQHKFRLREVQRPGGLLGAAGVEAGNLLQRDGRQAAVDGEPLLQRRLVVPAIESPPGAGHGSAVGLPPNAEPGFIREIDRDGPEKA
jgi:hypothetical protein